MKFTYQIPESQQEAVESILRRLTLNAFVTGSLEGKNAFNTNLDELAAQVYEQARAEWDEAVAAIPETVRLLNDGQRLGVQYKFLGKRNLLIGLTRVGPFMKIDPSVFIGYSASAFDNPAALDALVQNHRTMDEFSQQFLNQAFGNIPKVAEREESGEKFVRLISTNSNGVAYRMNDVAYRMKRALVFGLCNIFTQLKFHKSCGEVIGQKVADLQDDIIRLDAFAQFFRGEKRFIEAYSTNRTPSADVVEIGAHAKNVAYRFGRLRQEKLREMKSYVTYLPTQY